jgi:hypothetical protein
MNTKSLLSKDRILDYDLFITEMESKEEEPSHPVEKNIENKIKLTLIGKKKGAEKTMCKTENKQKRKIKKKSNMKRSSNVYDIDNFIIQNNAMRIHQRHERLDIPIPVFKEISFYYINTQEEENENEEDEVNILSLLIGEYR